MAEQAGLVQRLGTAVVLVGLVLLIPLGVAGGFLGLRGLVAAGLGSVFALLLALRTGWRRALVALPVLLGAFWVGALTSGTAGWVVLLTLVGVAVGLLSHVGLLVPAALVGVLASTTPVLEDGDGLAVQVVVAGVAAVYSLVVVRGLGVPPVVPGFRVPARDATLFAVVLGVIVAVAATVAVRSSDPHSYWLPATVFLLVLPTPGVRVSEHARQRVLGTLAAVALMVPVALLEPPGAVRIGLTAVVLVLMFAVPEPIWVNAGLSTVLVVLLLDPAGGGLEAGGSRILDVVLAAGLVLLGAAVLVWATGRLPSSSGRQEMTAEVVEAQTGT